MNRPNIALARLPDVDESVRFKLITWLLAAMPAGRAGRDGEPAVAVLFTGKKDDGLLKFMAEKTSRAAGAEDGQATAALEARYQAIEQMKRRATERQAPRTQ